MPRKFLIPLMTFAFLAAPAFAPVMTISGSARATSNLNSSRSNIYAAKVTQVDENAKTFTVIANGKQLTFTLPKQGSVPKVGKILDITYTGKPGDGPLVAIAVSDAGSPSDKPTK